MGNYMPLSGGKQMSGAFYMNSNTIHLLSTNTSSGTAWIDGNAYDVNITSNGNSGATYVNLRCNAYAQVRNVQNTAYLPMMASAFNTGSSLRYKTNINHMTNERAKKILGVDVYTFDYIDNVVEKTHQYDVPGVIAEFIEKEFPDVVHYKMIDGELKVDSVDLTKFIPYIMKVLQIHDEKINTIVTE